MKDEQIPVHQLEHTEPTVIQNPEEDMTILARWLNRGIEQGSRFWILVGGVIVVLTVVAVLSSGLAAGKSASAEAWIEVTQAKSVEDRLEIAKEHPNTPVALWAKLQSAVEEYSNGIDDLTSGTRKATAGPRLSKAYQLFEEVIQEAPKDSSQALGAMLGAARTLEARNELPEAIARYRDLANKFPNTPEAKQALVLAKALEEPVNIQFYKELYAYNPPATPPPSNILGGPGSMFNNLGAPSGTTPRPSGFDLPVPKDLDAPPTTGTTPAPIITPLPAETPKTEAPKAEAPKAEAPKAEAPKVEAPKAEAPKVEAPKAEAPKVETPTPPPSAPAKPAESPKTAEPPK